MRGGELSVFFSKEEKEKRNDLTFLEKRGGRGRSGPSKGGQKPAEKKKRFGRKEV